MKKLIIIAAMLFGAGAVFLFLKQTDKKTSTESSLVIGICADYQPFTFIQNNKVVGFDIDIVDEISKRLNRPVTYKDMSFEVLLLELQRGAIHMVAGGLTVTEERKEKVFFTTPYLQSAPLIALTNNANQNIKEFEDLFHKKVLVNEGYTSDTALSKFPQITIMRVDTVPEAFLALEGKKADAFVTAQGPYQSYKKSTHAHHFYEYILKNAEENCALAISKKYPELYGAVEKIIQEMLQDGTIDNLKQKWFNE